MVYTQNVTSTLQHSKDQMNTVQLFKLPVDVHKKVDICILKISALF